MKPFAEIYVVKGIERHFTGDAIVYVLCACTRENEAVQRGIEWAKERNAELKEQGLNRTASYAVQRTDLF